MTKYAFGEDEEEVSPQFQAAPFNVVDNFYLRGLLNSWAAKGTEDIGTREMIAQKARGADMSPRTLAALCGVESPAAKVDSAVLDRLVLRSSVYCDICQNETTESLQEILIAANNNVVTATKMMKLKTEVEGHCKVQPPAFYEDGNVFVKPKSFHITSGSKP